MGIITNFDQSCKTWGNRPASQNKCKPVPKKIWSYWHNPDTPDFIKACIASWRYYAPDFEITLLDSTTVSKLTGKVPYWVKRRSPTAISDWVRLKLLHKHGGIWMDASTLLFEKIENLLPDMALVGPDPFTFFNRSWSTDLDRPMIESWFISSPPKNDLIGHWMREYHLACVSRKTYLATMKLIYGKEKIFQGYPKINYFTVFAALQVVLMRNKNFCIVTCDSEIGPYRLHSQLEYDSDKIAHSLIEGPLSEIQWVKLSSEVREATIARLKLKPLPSDSPLFRFMPRN